MNPTALAERGLVPDPLVRLGIRRLLRRRLRDQVPASAEESCRRNQAFRDSLRHGPLALVPELANEQHYELAPAFFEQVLGPRLKYSCCLFEDGDDLAVAETRMLDLCCERAEVEDGMSLLDLGCGWGSLSLYLAQRFPGSRILAVSNSKPQREFILGRCRALGLENVEVVTADVNRFEPDRRFDRVLSIEMFEHVRNQERLLERIARWLAPGGALFVHHFAHRSNGYPFEADGDDDWMARHFFSGGIMPSDDHLLHLQRHLVVDRKWVVSGTHYQKTAEAWLARQDQRRESILPVLAEVYGAENAALWFQRWRLFFLACAELFGARNGNEWWVVHARMTPRPRTALGEAR
jgi:cyclopropane-fatty-acyl-phospholipid synthase